MDCSSKKRTRLPTSLPLDTEMFLFDHNNLTTVPNNAFSGCANLLHLDLSSTGITHVGTDAFVGVDQLHTLLLNNNSIDFTQLSPTAWGNLKQLANLSIHDNAICSNATAYNDRLFEPLEKLETHAMDALPNARPPGPGFSHLANLAYLNMFGDLRYIRNDTFRAFNQTRLNAFKVSGGILTDVEPLAFSHFSQLETLDLSFNPLLGFPNASKSWYGLQFTKISTLLLERAAPYNYEIITIERP